MDRRCNRICPAHESVPATDVLPPLSLPQVKPEERLGSDGPDDIRAHPWFEDLDWAALEARSVPAPITPELSGPVDASNFDDFADPPATPRFPPGQVLF